ncbi:MAG: cupin domain-containing protein [Lamprobacter sp.]|uniref:cupin domain-containing protein n=1 Tax=Lamprobacter sp. TaxID=3100796 RepID=UPI002B256DDF|nr:cupin domain-containing protein [Lamprobacter sp.]MEA3639615.1 cupin domain-containing protein [Lamprobacter sp.]
MNRPPEFPELRFPDGLDAETFLMRYWQRQPLLMRQALPGFENPLPGDELAGLACEPDVESRIILERAEQRPWQVQQGPFDAECFAALPPSHWTLLVQDVDKHIPEIGALLERFDFLPRWRIDDLMVSYAEDQGSVGPHVDDYDVFLLQAEGQRRWRIATDAAMPLELIPDLEIRILKQFRADQEWLLEPGDILYLPPGVPHWGVAEGACQTWSVGFRAPAWRELADDWLAQIAERFTPPGRWQDQRSTPPSDPAELDQETLLSMRAAIESGIEAAGAGDFAAWLGTWMTEPKLNLALAPREPPWPEAEVISALETARYFERDGRSRLLFTAPTAEIDQASLFANGQQHPVAAELLPLLAQLSSHRKLEFAEAGEWLLHPAARTLVTSLFNAGHYFMPNER